MVRSPVALCRDAKALLNTLTLTLALTLALALALALALTLTKALRKTFSAAKAEAAQL